MYHLKTFRVIIYLKSRKEKVVLLFESAKYEIVWRSKTEEKLKIIPSEFVQLLKHNSGLLDVYKAYFVSRGHKNRYGGHVVHNGTSSIQLSHCVLLVNTSISGFGMYAIDILFSIYI